MVDESDDGLPKSPVERIARRLIETARQEPSLLGRSRPLLNLGFSHGVPNATGSLPVPWGAGTSIALYQQCEQLASVAIDAAQQAEDAFAEARAAFARARRGMIAFGAFGLLGIAVAMVSVMMNHGHTAATPNISVASAAVAEQPLPDPESQPTAHAIYVPPLPLPDHQIARPAGVSQQLPPPTATYVSSAPWPTNNDVRYHPPTRYGHVVLPPFVLALQRDVSLLFHGP